jgi:hypothetical protein
MVEDGRGMEEDGENTHLRLRRGVSDPPPHLSSRQAVFSPFLSHAEQLKGAGWEISERFLGLALGMWEGAAQVCQILSGILVDFQM